MEYKRIIFDLNGTLFESLDYTTRVIDILQSYCVIFSTLNLEGFLKALATYEDYYDHYTLEDYCRHISECSGLNLDINFIKYFLYRADILAPSKVEDNVIEALEYLKNKYDLVVLTNYFAYAQYDQMVHAKIADYFSHTYGAEEVMKPSREAFIRACGEYSPEECIMIGDSLQKDINGAKKVPMDYIYLNKNGTFNGKDEVNDIKQLKLIL